MNKEVSAMDRISLQAALSEFATVSERLLRYWLRTGADMSYNYPFHKDFQELNLEIAEWARTNAEALSKGYDV